MLRNATGACDLPGRSWLRKALFLGGQYVNLMNIRLG